MSDIKNKTQKSNFKSADLHVHTPSSNCYKNDKSDEEYYLIIENYVKKGIKIIAITDHNTIAGYKKIIQLIKSYQEKIKILSDYIEENDNIKNEVDKLKNKLEIINQILILPGIEFEANPGIHLLFIFDPKTELELIDNFLIEAGYSIMQQGLEEISSVCVDVLDSLETIKKFNVITIAAHIDSNKGIFNDLHGQYRIRVFKSEHLDGVSVNSVTQIEKIKSILKDPNYTRETPLAIIQSSDHHKKDDCGKNITYFDINELTFDNLKECFKNQNEKISSTERPEIKNIIKKIADDENTICIPDIDKKIIYKTVSAILNNNFGSILIGVSDDKYKNIKGISIEKDAIKELKQEIINTIFPSKIFYSLIMGILPFGDNRVLHIRLLNISGKLFYYKNEIFLLDKDNQKIKKGDTEKIISLSNEKIIDDYILFQKNMDEQLNNLQLEIEIIQNNSTKYNIVKRILNDSINISKIIDLELIAPNNEISFNSKYNNGDYEGNCYYAINGEPRHFDIYIRCSCPIVDRDFNFNDLETYKNSSIIIVPGGAAHIIEKESFNFINTQSNYPILKISIDKEFFDLISLKTLLAWFKSSIFIWYTFTSLGNYDIFLPNIFNKICIPTLIFKDNTSVLIDQKISEIIKLENLYLEKQVKIFNSLDENIENKSKYIQELAESHNNSVHCIAKEIDHYFYDLFNINTEEENIIHNLLNHKGVLFFDRQ